MNAKPIYGAKVSDGREVGLPDHMTDRKHEIPSALCDLMRETETLEELFGHLCSRLEPIRASRPQATQEGANPLYCSKVAIEISGTNHRLSSLNEAIRTLLVELEI
jgi:hypothetical protein